jgi:hypothetical protein
MESFMFNDSIRLDGIYDQFSVQFSKFIPQSKSNTFKSECWDKVMDKILSSLVQHIFTIQRRPKHGVINNIKQSILCHSQPSFKLKKNLVDYLYKVKKTKAILNAMKVG